jgi:hypothetical protein
LTGPVLAQAAPSGLDNGFNVNVTIPPDAAPGDTFIAATQQQSDGTPVPGTPARQPFTVLAPPAPPAPDVTPPEPDVTPAPPVVVSTAAVIPQPKVKTNLKAALATCNRKYNPGKTKSRRAKRLMARRRAACIAQAHAAAITPVVATRALEASLSNGIPATSLIAILSRRDG